MFLVLAAFIAPLILRLAQITELQSRISSSDLRGLLADLGLSLLLAALAAWLLLRIRRKVSAPLVALMLCVWALLNFGNFEHIATLGTIADWSNAQYLLDETFLMGSAFQISELGLFALSLLLPLLCFLLYVRSSTSSLKVALLPVLSALCIVSYYFLPINPAYAGWRQTNFILENLDRLTDDEYRSAEHDEGSIFGIYPQDLGGSPIVKLDNPRTNVLLVVLEGVSGATLDTVAAAQGLTGERPKLPSLNAKLKDGLTYLNFVNHQRQTNRGLYSLVCGDLPKLRTDTPKMTEASLHREPLFCLPEALRRSGYRTVFLQSAPLSFMGKDAFAEKAGFEEFYGVEWFRKSDKVSAWGADDKLFLSRSAELIEELQQGDHPWHLTLLTSGTHHPFNVPESFVSPHEKRTFAHAVDYLDKAVAEFLRVLEAKGVFDNTLVLFTSDESFGLSGEMTTDQRMLSQAWGYLVAFLPSKESGIVEQPFMQTDVAGSVLDYLGLEAQAAHFRGRSIFRKYLAPRALPFANTYLRLTGFFSADGNVHVCDESLSSECRVTPLADPARLFGPLGADYTRAVPPAELAALVARSLDLAPALASTGATKQRDLFQTPTVITLPFSLMQRRSLEKRKEQERYGKGDVKLLATFRLFGEQYLSLKEGERAEVELEVAVSEDSSAVLYHTFTAVAFRDMPSGREYVEAIDDQQERLGLGDDELGIRPRYGAKTQKLLGRTVHVPAGDVLRYRYSFVAEEDFERVQFTLLASPGEAEDAVIEIRKAALTIRPMEPEDKPGLTVHLAEPDERVSYHHLGYSNHESD